VPFAFAAGAMLSGKTDERWIVATRRWTLTAWTFLGFGQLLGAHWAYLEVGWGGYYSWDPVEIAALMPWLAATAFLHSVMIQERKGMLRVWNMVLVAFAFDLSLFGTFLTRSGVVNSIHSFAKSSIGAWFLGFVVLASIASMVLIIWRLPLLSARTKLESAVSREAAFLYNNLLFVALTLTLLWGEVFPILTQFVEGYQRTMGRPYYDFFLRIFGLPLLLLMGIGPLIAWRRASIRALFRTLRWPLAAAVLAGIALIAIGDGSSKPGLIAYTFCAFALTAIVVELVRGTRATGSLFELIGRNRRRYGGYIVHVAIVLFVIGVVGSSDFSTQRERQLSVGQSMKIDGYTLTYHGLTHTASNTESGSSVETSALLSYSGRISGTMETSQVNSSALGVSREVGIRTNWLRAEDLYTILDAVGQHGSAYIIVEVEPLVNLIWFAGYLFLAGALVAMWPNAREQRRLATRLSLARAA
jgi:cytochrome c-type biogenesis protein CcmF